MFCFLRRAVRWEGGVLRTDGKGSLPPEWSVIAACDQFGSHFSNFLKSIGQQEGRLNDNWDSGGLMGRRLFPLALFPLQGSVGERALNLGLGPGFITF